MPGQLRSCAELVKLIDKWGFVPLFKNEIQGFSVEELCPSELWFADDVEGPWEWKGPAIRESGCAYGKFFCGKAVFISREWFSHFANCRSGGLDFDERYDEGLAGYTEKIVYRTLSEHPSLLSRELKRLAGFGRDGRKGFDAAISRLQMMGYVTTTNFEYSLDKYGIPYGWGMARYATVEKHFGPDFAGEICSPEESGALIAAHISSLFPEAEQKSIAKLVG